MTLIELFERGAGRLAKSLPGHAAGAAEADLARRAEIAALVGDLCRQAQSRGGWRAVVRTGLAEWTNLAWTSLAAASRRQGAITAGRRSAPHVPGKGAPVSRVLSDLRLAIRSLRASRAHSMLVVFTLALGIGLNTAVFSVVDSIVFRPVPYPLAERIATLWTYYAPGSGRTLGGQAVTFRGGFGPALIREWRKQTDLFDRVEAFESKSMVYESESGAEMIAASVVTPGLMDLLGAAPMLGRGFDETDGRSGTDRTVILSERFWSETLHRDPAAVERTIVLDGERYAVIGVMPRSFRFPDLQQQVWLPYDVVAPPAGASASARLVPAVRMQPGLTVEAIDQRVIERGARVNAAAGGDGQASARPMALGLVFDTRTTRSLYVLGGAVLFLLLIVCANVANLTMARSLARARERAVRAALGATRFDLVRQALVEQFVLGCTGALLGLVVARLALDLTGSFLPDQITLTSLNAVDLDTRALAFLSFASVSSVMLFGLPPAIVGSRGNVLAVLGHDSRSSIGSTFARRCRAGLVVAEVTLSIVLLVGAALMTRSLLKLQAIDVGMDTAGLVTVRVGLRQSGYADPAARDRFTGELLQRLRNEPDVGFVSAGSLPPVPTTIAAGALELADRPGEKTKPTVVPVYPTWPGYFAAAGIRILEGREPWSDAVESPVVISQDMAATHWQNRSALGQRFRVGNGPWRTVVGIASAVRRLSEDDDAGEFEVYARHDQMDGLMRADRPAATIADYRTIISRADSPAAAAALIRRVVHDVDPRVVVSATTLVAHEFADSIARPRIVFFMLTVFAAFGLLLAAAGLYGVLSYLVSQRMREIGIRLAIGARPSDVRRLVLGTGLALAGAGLVLGLGAAAWLVRVMRAILYEIEPFDPVSLAAVSAVLAVTAVLACWRPARRAMRADPVALLRES